LESEPDFAELAKHPKVKELFEKAREDM
jgi:hypothetical protein